MTPTLPAIPGTYGLILWLPYDTRARIGRLGTYDFPAGWYAYWGSAHGPGGLAARIRHHVNLTTRPHWHFDFLRPHGQIKAVLFTLHPDDLECLWVQRALTFLMPTFRRRVSAIRIADKGVLPTYSTSALI